MKLTFLKDDSRLLNHRFFWLSAYLFILGLYALVGFTSYGYDDEFYNIRWIEKYGIDVISFTQSRDKHPPGSYILNWLLYNALGQNWSFVRVAISLFTASIIIYAIKEIKERYGNFNALLLFILLGLNPAVLMWCTSLRWYSFFVPVLIFLSITPKYENKFWWPRCFLGLVILGYLGYAALLVAPSILLLYWSKSSLYFSEKLKKASLWGALLSSLYWYQFYILINVHLNNEDVHTASIFKTILSIGTAQFSNQGVFPLSVPGVISAFGVLGSISLFLYSNLIKRTLLTNGNFLNYIITTILFIVSGTIEKIRKLVILSPLPGLWFATENVSGKYKNLSLFFIACILLGNLGGISNVIQHNGTSKNSWNIPTRAVLNHVTSLSTNCNNDIIILTHDAQLTYTLENSGHTVLSPHIEQRNIQPLLNSRYSCMLLLKTFMGSIKPSVYNSLYQEVELFSSYKISTTLMGRDSFYKVKRMINKQFPEYQVEATVFNDVTMLNQLQHWIELHAHNTI